MLSDIQRHIVENACVTVHYGDCREQGVLVGGQLILTAAHNVLYVLEQKYDAPLASTLVGMALDDHVVVEIETTHGLLHVKPVAIEPATDIAVLGALDDQVFFKKWEAYETWCEAVAPVPLCYDQFPFMTPIPVAVYTHRGTWLEGTAQQGGPTTYGFWITMPEGIEGGTSGSPIVTTQGTITGLNLSSKLSFALSWGPLQRGGPPWHISTREPVPMLSFGIAHRSQCQRWKR